MSIRTEHGEWGDVWVLSDAGLEARILPELGGKIASLIDRATGRDWLWKNPHLSFERPRPGASYVRDFDSGGFDECFPAVSAGAYPAGPWQGLEIPDHGELWTVAWDAEQADGRLYMRARTRTFPIAFERTARLEAGRLRLDYRVTNPTDHAFPFLWSSHPLLALEEGMRILLPEGHGLEVYGSDRLGDRHAPITWPQGGTPFAGDPQTGISNAGEPHAGSLDLSRPSRRGWSAKLSGPAPARGWVGLAHGPRQLRMAFDSRLVTDLGLWLNMGGWSGVPGAEPYFNLGLEPCIGWGDDLGYAVTRGLSHGLLPAHHEAGWWLELGFEGAEGLSC